MLLEYFKPFASQFKDENLKALAELIPKTLLKSRAKTTVTHYLRGFGIWKDWCTNFPELEVLPVKGLHLTLFILGHIQNNSSFHLVKQTFYGVKWVHNLLSLKSPCKSSMVKLVYEAAKRCLSKPVRKKEIITPFHLYQLAKSYGKSKNSLKDVRTLTICVLGFAAFLRYSELANLRRCDILIYKNYFKLFIESSKTDIYRDGFWVVVARTRNKTCPFSILRRYLKLISLRSSSDEFIFRALTYYKKSCSYKLRKKNQPLSYSAARSIVLDAFESIGLPKDKFGLHSLRAGGASAAANAGVSDRLFKRHGRWKSEKAKDGYVKDSLKALLSVTKNIGI